MKYHTKVCEACKKDFETTRVANTMCRPCVKKKCSREVAKRNKSPYHEIGIKAIQVRSK